MRKLILVATRRLRVIVLLLTPVLLLGCATMGGLQSEPLSEGVLRTYDEPFEQVVNAARVAVAQAGLQIENAYQPTEDTWMILSKKGSSGFSWGEMVRVVVERTSDGKTAVRVISRRKGTLNVAAKGDYSDSIFSGIELTLQSSSN